MTGLDWFIVFLLNGAVIAFGFYLARSTKSSSDWFLGGRSLPWWGLGLSIFATSSASFLGFDHCACAAPAVPKTKR